MGNRYSTKLTRSGLSATMVFAMSSAAFAACSQDTVSVRGDFGGAQFTVQVADTTAERAQGLMFVETMATMEGMLFVYDRPQSVSFWMRNTLIPLDMVFVGPDGVVDNIHVMAQPLDETSIYGGDDVQYVLEINGGMADRLGLSIGDEMQHLSFGEAAIWPCAPN